MMKAVLINWSVMRVLRLLMGLIILVQSIIQKDISLSIAAGILMLLAIANIGCCGPNGCTVNFSNLRKEKEIIYEKLDNK